MHSIIHVAISVSGSEARAVTSWMLLCLAFSHSVPTIMQPTPSSVTAEFSTLLLPLNNYSLATILTIVKGLSQGSCMQCIFEVGSHKTV